MNPTEIPTTVGQTVAIESRSAAAHCQLTSNGTCITDGPGDYGPDEDCTFAVLVAGTIGSVGAVATESAFDWLFINRTDGFYQNWNAEGTSVEVVVGDRLYWHSDHSGQRAGWTLCLIPFSLAPATSGPTAALTTPTAPPAPTTLPPAAGSTTAPTGPPPPAAGSTAPPADAPITTMCVDTNGGAVDTGGDVCTSYSILPVSYCGDYDDADFSATDMCCHCGGGSTALVPSQTSSTAAPPSSLVPPMPTTNALAPNPTDAPTPGPTGDGTGISTPAPSTPAPSTPAPSTSTMPFAGGGGPLTPAPSAPDAGSASGDGASSGGDGGSGGSGIIIIIIFVVVALALLVCGVFLWWRKQQAAGGAGSTAGKSQQVVTAPYNDVRPCMLTSNPTFNARVPGGGEVAPGVGDNGYTTPIPVFDAPEYAVPGEAGTSGNSNESDPSVQWRQEVRKPGASKSMVGLHGSSKPTSGQESLRQKALGAAGSIQGPTAPAPSPPPRSTVESSVIAEWTGKSGIRPAAETELATVDPSYLAPVVLNPQ